MMCAAEADVKKWKVFSLITAPVIGSVAVYQYFNHVQHHHDVEHIREKVCVCVYDV